MLTKPTLRRLMLVAALAGLLGATAAVPPVAAQSDDDCWRWIEVVIGEDENGDPIFGPKLVDTCQTQGSDSGRTGPQVCEHSDLGEVPCTDPVMGWFSHAEDCYVRLMSPQPPAEEEVWDGHNSDEGAIYLFHCWVQDDWRIRQAFLPGAPDLPSVSEVAQQAIERLDLTGAAVGIAPQPDGVGLVGVPVWMWTEDPDSTWGRLTESASIPGVMTVTAVARATQIEWDMGDGHVEVCENPGTPYDPSHGGDPSPDCGYDTGYPRPSRGQPGGTYTVTAATTWRVDWWVEPRGSGAESTEWPDPADFTTTVEVTIHELHVVTS